MGKQQKIFFDFLHFCIGSAKEIPSSLKEVDWKELYAIAKKQALIGVCFAGVQKLVGQQQEPPEMLYLNWLGMAAMIQQRNEVVNRQCV